VARDTRDRAVRQAKARLDGGYIVRDYTNQTLCSVARRAEAVRMLES